MIDRAQFVYADAAVSEQELQRELNVPFRPCQRAGDLAEVESPSHCPGN